MFGIVEILRNEIVSSLVYRQLSQPFGGARANKTRIAAFFDVRHSGQSLFFGEFAECKEQTTNDRGVIFLVVWPLTRRKRKINLRLRSLVV